MGSIFARPPARAAAGELLATLIALEGTASRSLADVAADGLEPPLVICLGAEREGLPAAILERAATRARIPLRPDGPDSLNVAMAATVALYALGGVDAPDATTRMAPHG
jgi:tRNA G18 (ribose-2'-O)-methylase SpoU